MVVYSLICALAVVVAEYWLRKSAKVKSVEIPAAC